MQEKKKIPIKKDEFLRRKVSDFDIATNIDYYWKNANEACLLMDLDKLRRCFFALNNLYKKIDNHIIC